MSGVEGLSTKDIEQHEGHSKGRMQKFTKSVLSKFFKPHNPYVHGVVRVNPGDAQPIPDHDPNGPDHIPGLEGAVQAVFDNPDEFKFVSSEVWTKTLGLVKEDDENNG